MNVLTNPELSSAIFAFQQGHATATVKDATSDTKQTGRNKFDWVSDADLCASCGHISLLEYFSRSGEQLIVTPRAYVRNPHGVSEKALAWLLCKGVTVPPSYGDLCAKVGDTATLVRLRDTLPLPCTFNAAIYAAEHGHANVLWLLFNKFAMPKNPRLLEAAVASGKLCIVKYLYDQSVPCTERAFLKAIAEGKAHIARFIIEQDANQVLPQNVLNKAATQAAANGMMREVQWLHAKGARFSLDGAADRGHERVVKYLNEQCNASATVKAMTAAAVHGHVEIVKYLFHHRNEGCEPNVMDLCAGAGQLQVSYRLLSSKRVCMYS
jgi:hypothetical protein